MPTFTLACKQEAFHENDTKLLKAVTMKVKTLPLRLPAGMLRRRSSMNTACNPTKDLPPLLQLARQRKFDVIIDTFAYRSDAEVSGWIDNCSLSMNDDASGIQTFKGETILHLIMLYQPPVEIVHVLIQKMIEKRPDTVPEAATDMLSRTPLHIAVAHDCDIAVIDRLLNGAVSVVPAVTKDAQQRLPLHWACAGTKSLSKDNWWQGCAVTRIQSSENMVKIIEALVRAYPHAAMVKDQAGMTPLDLAVSNHAHPYIIRLLDDICSTKSGVDHSNSGTEDTFDSDVPYEIDNPDDTSVFGLDDGDDVSSIGTGGISTYNWNGRKRVVRSNQLPYINEQCQI